MKKQLPILMTDEEAEDFVANADLTEYDLSKLTCMKIEFKQKDKLADPQDDPTWLSVDRTKE